MSAPCLPQDAKITLVEGNPVIGGTCVNIGCVLSKIMIRSADIVLRQKHHNFRGIQPSAPRVDRSVLLEQQQDRMHELRKVKSAFKTDNPERRLAPRGCLFQGHPEMAMQLKKRRDSALSCPADTRAWCWTWGRSGRRTGSRTWCRPCRRPSDIARRARLAEIRILRGLDGRPVRFPDGRFDRVFRLARFIGLVRVIMTAGIRVIAPAGSVIGIAVTHTAVYRVTGRSAI